jgi:hypothetical protein
MGVQCAVFVDANFTSDCHEADSWLAVTALARVDFTMRIMGGVQLKNVIVR